jgi:GntR family transcriptional regulator/MocR family aminotransferase
MQGLDPERVIYGGTASKSLAPGLGLAWLVLPPMLLEPVLDTMRLRRDTVSSIEQAALAEFIGSGRLDRHVRAQRLHYRRRRDAMMTLLADKAPWLEVAGVSAGLHMTAFLRDRDERQVIEHAARQSVALLGIANHSVTPPTRHGLVIGYSRSAAHSYARALEMLASVLEP